LHPHRNCPCCLAGGKGTGKGKGTFRLVEFVNRP